MSSPTASNSDEDQQLDGAVIDIDEIVNIQQKEKGEATSRDFDEEFQVGTKEDREEIVKPIQIFYAKRDILDLSCNIVGSKSFCHFTVLPDNNLKCFFQNRAQYWRLSSGKEEEHLHEKCLCCDFTYPKTQPEKRPTASINEVTDSLLVFLRSTDQASAMPNIPSKATLNQNLFGYQMQQQNSYAQRCNSQNIGLFNNSNANFSQPNTHFSPNSSGYGTLALLNLISNASRNATTAFQAMSCNSINNNTPHCNNNLNNSFGLYKQF